MRFGKGKMMSNKYVLLAAESANDLPGFYAQGDVALLRRGVQFHEYDFERAGFEVYGRMHAFER